MDIIGPDGIIVLGDTTPGITAPLAFTILGFMTHGTTILGITVVGIPVIMVITEVTDTIIRRLIIPIITTVIIGIHPHLEQRYQGICPIKTIDPKPRPRKQTVIPDGS